MMMTMMMTGCQEAVRCVSTWSWRHCVIQSLVKLDVMTSTSTSSWRHSRVIAGHQDELLTSEVPLSNMQLMRTAMTSRLYTASSSSSSSVSIYATCTVCLLPTTMSVLLLQSPAFRLARFRSCYKSRRKVAPLRDDLSFCMLHLAVPRHRRSTLGRWAFFVAGPMAWNALPDDLPDPSVSADNFRKTHLFRNALGHLAH